MPDGSFRFATGDYGRVLGWAQTAANLTTLIRPLGYDAAGAGNHLPRHFGAQPPTSPPADLRHLFDFSQEIAQLTSDHPNLMEVLRHLGAIRAQIPATEAAMLAWISDRASQLQDKWPQVRFVDAFNGRLEVRGGKVLAFAEYCAWVDPRLVISTSDLIWGVFDRREEVIPDIVRSVRDAADMRARLTWVKSMFADQPPDVVRVDGPGGPVYRVGMFGNHRTHAARILGLPFMLAEVHLGELPYPTIPGSTSAADECVWRNLRKRKALTADVVESVEYGHIWTPVNVVAEWMLLATTYAVETNRCYETLYPGALTRLTGLKPSQLGDESEWEKILSRSSRWVRVADRLRQSRVIR